MPSPNLLHETSHYTSQLSPVSGITSDEDSLSQGVVDLGRQRVKEWHGRARGKAKGALEASEGAREKDGRDSVREPTETTSVGGECRCRT